jgi:hypothetical protein
MAHISRSYDNADLIKRLIERYPDINLGQGRVESVDISPPTGNETPTLNVHVRFPLTEEDITHILANPA